MKASIGKLGTVCHITELNSKGQPEQLKQCKMGTITRATMLKICGIDKQPELLTDELVQRYFKPLQAKLLPKVKQNLQALREQIKVVASLPENLRLFRISSDLLPLFDHPVLGNLYDDNLRSMIDFSLAATKKIIDDNGIRVSCHPDAFCIPNSDREDVRLNSFRTLYMHKYFMGQLTDNVVINIHFSGKMNHIPEWDRGEYLDLIPVITVENEDKVNYSKPRGFYPDTENTLVLCEKYGIRMLFDIHHHFVVAGEYLEASSNTLQRIISTWQGKRPLFHISQGRDAPMDKKHSDYITDSSIITLLNGFLQYGDVEVEAKGKLQAVQALSKLVG